MGQMLNKNEHFEPVGFELVQKSEKIEGHWLDAGLDAGAGGRGWRLGLRGLERVARQKSMEIIEKPSTTSPASSPASTSSPASGPAARLTC